MPLCSKSVGVRGSDRGFVVSRTSVSASFLPLAPTRQSDSASLLQRIEVGDKIFCTKTSRLINLPLFTPHIASSPPIAGRPRRRWFSVPLLSLSLRSRLSGPSFIPSTFSPLSDGLSGLLGELCSQSRRVISPSFSSVHLLSPSSLFDSGLHLFSFLRTFWSMGVSACARFCLPIDGSRRKSTRCDGKKTRDSSNTAALRFQN